MAEVDWEKRARELEATVKLDDERPFLTVGDALQLGREMADASVNHTLRLMDIEVAKAADARAEEIAQAIINNAWEGASEDYLDGWHDACMSNADICRSTIAKAEMRPSVGATDGEREIAFEPDLIINAQTGERTVPAEAAIRADEREKIAAMIQAAARGHSTPHWLEASDHFLRILRPPPKTREAVLEGALREIIAKSEELAKTAPLGVIWTSDAPRTIARRALEYRP